MDRTQAGKILVVDDEVPTAEAFREIIGDMGFTADCVFTAEEGLTRLADDSGYFLVISDLRLPEMNGTEFIQRALVLNKDLMAVMITAFGSITSAVDAMKLGIKEYLTKPVDFEKLKLTVNNLAEQRLIMRENMYLKSKLLGNYSFHNLVGKSRKMRDVFELAARVSNSSAGVLLRGESGTGKGLLARAIHFNSPRKAEPLVELNCAALPDSLLESELFGHVKGAFTGASFDRRGRFEEAGGGTIFLDEIGEMGTALQAKLLRVLQERVFERVGSNRQIKFVARVIASTNRDLEAAVREKTFREDLYYRLNVVPIHLPPLRERTEDIPFICEFFLKKYCRENSVPLKQLSQRAMEKLLVYHWPGNVRELENFIERICVIVDSAVIQPEHFMGLGTAGPDPGDGPDARGSCPKELRNPEDLAKAGGLPGLMAARERDIIAGALDSCGGHRMTAAQMLSISLRQLQYKISKYGLE